MNDTDTDTNALSDSARLQAAARQIDEIREALGWSKQVLLRSYGELGTDRTYARCLASQTSDINVERWLAAYEAVLEQLQNGGVIQEEELVSDMSGPLSLRKAVVQLRTRQAATARFILITGDSSTGKSKSALALTQQSYAASAIMIEASDAWASRSGTAGALLRAVAEGLKLRDLPQQRDQLLDEIVARLNDARRILIIDEIHHLDPHGINVIKTLINRCPGLIVIGCALPSLWSKLETGRHSWADTRQLTLGRMHCRISLQIEAADVAILLRSRLPALTAEQAAELASDLTPEAKRGGNYQFINAVARHLAELGSPPPWSEEALRRVIAEVRKTR